MKGYPTFNPITWKEAICIVIGFCVLALVVQALLYAFDNPP